MERNNVILIPALNPPKDLIKYVDLLMESGFKKIILVNDGSHEKFSSIFKKIRENVEIDYLEHTENQGKGRALKSGLEFFLEKYANDEKVHGIITVDSDGQHLVDDVIKISDEIDSTKIPTLFLGIRNFDSNCVPFKSKFGNKITTIIFGCLNGKYIKDTQTGLRGICKEILMDDNKLVKLEGERFEYEINMLIYAVRKSIFIKEIPIETVYINNNSETHFRPIKDSWKIYKIIFSKFVKYVCSSLISCSIDLIVFEIFLILLKRINVSSRIFFCTIIARVVSSIVNFFLNKKVVFENKERSQEQFVKYYILCICQMLLSAILVIGLNCFVSGEKIIMKIVVDSILFFISYHIQRKLIFKEKE